MMTDVLEAARAYVELGWCVIPVLPRDKRPGWEGRRQAGWDKLRLSPAELPRFFTTGANIGVLLGEPSGDLVDVDLDSAEAIELAAQFLPPTWIFGRAGKPRSHWLYLATGAVTRQFRMPESSAKTGEMLVELRASGLQGRAFQTVFPPSFHACGELIGWEENCDAFDRPRRIDTINLIARVSKLAAACVAMRCAGRDAAEKWLITGKCPPLPPEAAERIREWWGLQEQAGPTDPQKIVFGDLDERVERARRYLERYPPAISGSGGHVRTLLAAEHLVRGFQLDDVTAFELLATEYSPRCQPPWSKRELEHKVSEARKKGTAVVWGQHLRDERCHA